jgi:hypothetical protein
VERAKLVEVRSMEGLGRTFFEGQGNAKKDPASALPLLGLELCKQFVYGAIKLTQRISLTEVV